LQMMLMQNQQEQQLAMLEFFTKRTNKNWTLENSIAKKTF
jgi:hypothetical protein